MWYPPPLGRAEQRSSVRIKTLALFERSEFASVPNAASSARNPKGTDVARLFLLTFFGEAKKVSRPPGRDPACHRSKTNPPNQTPSLLPQGTARRAPTTSFLTPTPSPLHPHPSLLTRARHAVPLRPSSLLTPHSSLLPPHSYDLTPHSSLLRPHSSLLPPPSSLLTPTTSLLTPTTSLLPPHPSLLTNNGASACCIGAAC